MSDMINLIVNHSLAAINAFKKRSDDVKKNKHTKPNKTRKKMTERISI